MVFNTVLSMRMFGSSIHLPVFRAVASLGMSMVRMTVLMIGKRGRVGADDHLMGYELSGEVKTVGAFGAGGRVVGEIWALGILSPGVREV
jgi:hypothetical protein